MFTSLRLKSADVVSHLKQKEEVNMWETYKAVSRFGPEKGPVCWDKDSHSFLHQRDKNLI